MNSRMWLSVFSPGWKHEILNKSWQTLLCITWSGLQIRVNNWKLIFLFINQNICCGYLKEPSRWDGYFEHPKHMFKLMGKKKQFYPPKILPEPMLDACLIILWKVYPVWGHVMHGILWLPELYFCNTSSMC